MCARSPHALGVGSDDDPLGVDCPDADSVLTCPSAFEIYGAAAEWTRSAGSAGFAGGRE